MKRTRITKELFDFIVKDDHPISFKDTHPYYKTEYFVAGHTITKIINHTKTDDKKYFISS